MARNDGNRTPGIQLATDGKWDVLILLHSDPSPPHGRAPCGQENDSDQVTGMCQPHLSSG